MSKKSEKCCKCKWWSRYPRITGKTCFGTCKLTGCVVYVGTRCAQFNRKED